MGMTIDEAIGWIKKSILDMRRAQICTLDRFSLETAIDTMRKYQQFQSDYENRLKADMVAMLTEIQLEIEEMENPYTTRVSGCAQGGFERGARESQNLIQQKINSLKEA